MAMTASKLREDIYNILDRVLETGIPIEVVRNGRTLKIVAEDPPSKLDNLVERPDVWNGDVEEIARIGWTHDGDWYIKPAEAVATESNIDSAGTSR